MFSVSARRRIFNPSPSYSIISNMAAEKCSEVVRKIASSSSKKEVLESLQELSALINSASCNLRDVSPHIPLDVLFGCFNTSNHEQITLCKWILNKLLPLEKSDVIVSKYHDLIIEGLNHPSVEVRELCLSELQRCSSNVHGLLALLEKTDVLVYTARALADDNLSCTQKAAKVLKNASRHESGLKMIFEHELQSEFDELLLKKDVIRFRLYELFVAIQALSSEAFRSCKDSGILMKLLNELDGEDVLLRMNCVELLTELANSGKNGLDFLEDAGVLVKLNNVLLSLESDPMVSLMIPGKTFRGLGRGVCVGGGEGGRVGGKGKWRPCSKIVSANERWFYFNCADQRSRPLILKKFHWVVIRRTL